MVKHGISAFAILGVNRHELQASIDAALTFGILWLDSCRNAHADNLVIEGLKLFIPRGCSAVVRERIAHLDSCAVKWELHELDECTSIEVLDCGKVLTRLVRCPDEIEINQRIRRPHRIDFEFQSLLETRSDTSLYPLPAALGPDIHVAALRAKNWALHLAMDTLAVQLTLPLPGV